jgi:hypothetical protein
MNEHRTKFGPSPPDVVTDTRGRTSIAAIAALVVFAISLITFALQIPDTAFGWSLVGLMLALAPFGLALFVFAMSVAGLASLARSVALGVMFVVTTYVAGPAAVLAFVLVAGAAWALGDAVLRPNWSAGSPLSEWLTVSTVCVLLGLSILAGASSLLITQRVHFPAVYACAFVLTIIWGRRRIALSWRTLSGPSWRQDREEPASWQHGFSGLALGLYCIGALGALFPITAFDDLAYHLRFASELNQHGRALFDVSHQVWMAAPFAADLIFGIVYLLSGGEDGAKSVLHLFYHFGAALFVFRLGACYANRFAAWMVTALYLSLPLHLNQTHQLQTELLSGTFVLAIFWLRFAPGIAITQPRAWIAAMLLLALLGATKASNLVFVAALGLMWVPVVLHELRQSPKRASIVLLLSAVILVTPYFYAWHFTGNPVFPLFNAVFKSPLFPIENFSNPAFTGKFDLNLLAAFTFESHRHLETVVSTAAGLQWWLLLPVALAMSLRLNGNNANIARLSGVAVWVAAIPVLLLLSQQQYLRYAYPMFGVLSIVLLALFHPVSSDTKLSSVLMLAGSLIAAPLLVFNVHSMFRVYWQFESTAIAGMFLPEGRERFVAKYAPERVFNRRVNADLGRDAMVLYANDPYGGDLVGRPLYVSWYNSAFESRFYGATTPAKMARLLQEKKVTHVITTRATRLMKPWTIASHDALQAVLKEVATPVSFDNSLALYRLPDDWIWPDTLATVTANQQNRHVSVGPVSVTGLSSLSVDVSGHCRGKPDQTAKLIFSWQRKGHSLSFQHYDVGCSAPLPIRLTVGIPAYATHGLFTLALPDSEASLDMRIRSRAR